MAACYADDAVFEDPAFGVLKNGEVQDMWRMLIDRSQGNLEIVFSDIKTEGDTGTAKWEAKYPFSKTGRNIHNKISAKFIFRNGKIIDHRDSFDLWKWAGMALGTPGKLLGWTPFMKNKIRETALSSLKKWQKKNN
jgi:hypothetical protein